MTYVASFVEPSLFAARDDLVASGNTETTRYGGNLITMILALDYSFGSATDNEITYFENLGAGRPVTGSWDTTASDQAIESMHAIGLAVSNPVSSPWTSDLRCKGYVR